MERSGPGAVCLSSPAVGNLHHGRHGSLPCNLNRHNLITSASFYCLPGNLRHVCVHASPPARSIKTLPALVYLWPCLSIQVPVVSALHLSDFDFLLLLTWPGLLETHPFSFDNPHIAAHIMKNKDLTSVVSSAPAGFLRRSNRLRKSTMPTAMLATPHKDDLDET